MFSFKKHQNFLKSTSGLTSNLTDNLTTKFLTAMVVLLLIVSQLGSNVLGMLSPVVAQKSATANILKMLGVGGLGNIQANAQAVTSSSTTSSKSSLSSTIVSSSKTTTSSLTSSLVSSSSKNPTVPNSTSSATSSGQSNITSTQTSSSRSSLATSSQVSSSSQSSNSKSSSSQSSTSSSAMISYPTSLNITESGIASTVAVDCVDDGDPINVNGVSTPTFSLVFKYTNTSGRIEIDNSRLVPSRPVIHTHFDRRDKDSLNYNDPNITTKLSGPITYLKGVSSNTSSPNGGNPTATSNAITTEPKAMVIQGQGNEIVLWKFNILDGMGRAIVDPKTGLAKEYTVGTDKNFKTKCPKPQVKIVDTKAPVSSPATNTTTINSSLNSSLNSSSKTNASNTNSSNTNTSSKSSIPNTLPNSNLVSNGCDTTTTTNVNNINATQNPQYCKANTNSSTNSSATNANINTPIKVNFGLEKINDASANEAIAGSDTLNLFDTITNFDTNPKTQYVLATERDPEFMDQLDTNGKPTGRKTTKVKPTSTAEGLLVKFYEASKFKPQTDGNNGTGNITGLGTDRVGKYWLYDVNTGQIKSAIDGYCLASTIFHTDSIRGKTADNLDVYLNASQNSSQNPSTTNTTNNYLILKKCNNNNSISPITAPNTVDKTVTATNSIEDIIKNTNNNLANQNKTQSWDISDTGDSTMSYLKQRASNTCAIAEWSKTGINNLTGGLLNGLIGNAGYEDKWFDGRAVKMDGMCNNTDTNGATLSTSIKTVTNSKVFKVNSRANLNDYNLISKSAQDVRFKNANTLKDKDGNIKITFSQITNGDLNYVLTVSDTTGQEDSRVNFDLPDGRLNGQYWYYEPNSKMIYSDFYNKCLAIKQVGVANRNNHANNDSYFIIETCSTTDNRQKWSFETATSLRVSTAVNSNNMNNTSSYPNPTVLRNLASLDRNSANKTYNQPLCAVAQWSVDPTKAGQYLDKWYAGRPAKIDAWCNGAMSQIFNINIAAKINTDPVITKSFPLFSIVSKQDDDGKTWKLDVKDGVVDEGSELQVWEQTPNNLNQFFAYNTETNEIYYNPNKNLTPDNTKVKIPDPKFPNDPTKTIEVPAFVNKPSDALKCLDSGNGLGNGLGFNNIDPNTGKLLKDSNNNLTNLTNGMGGVKGSTIKIRQCTGEISQKWNFTYYNGNLSAPIIRSLAQNWCMDAKLDGITNPLNKMFDGRKMVLWDCLWNSNQIFQVVQQGKLLADDTVLDKIKNNQLDNQLDEYADNLVRFASGFVGGFGNSFGNSFGSEINRAIGGVKAMAQSVITSVVCQTSCQDNRITVCQTVTSNGVPMMIACPVIDIKKQNTVPKLGDQWCDGYTMVQQGKDVRYYSVVMPIGYRCDNGNLINSAADLKALESVKTIQSLQPKPAPVPPAPTPQQQQSQQNNQGNQDNQSSNNSNSSTLTGNYTISYLFDPSFVMDVNGGGTADQTQVWVYAKNNTNGQKWTYYSSTGQIKGIANKCLDSGSGTLNQILRINTCHGGNNQKWDVQADQIKQGNNCISIRDGIRDGSTLVMGSCSANNCGSYLDYMSTQNASNYSGYCRGVSSGTGGGSGSTTGGGSTTSSGQGQGSQPSQPAPAPSGNGGGSGGNSGQQNNSQGQINEDIYPNGYYNQNPEKAVSTTNFDLYISGDDASVWDKIGYTLNDYSSKQNAVTSDLYQDCALLNLLCKGQYAVALFNFTSLWGRLIYGVIKGMASVLGDVLVGLLLFEPGYIIKFLYDAVIKDPVGSIGRTFDNMKKVLSQIMNYDTVSGLFVRGAEISGANLIDGMNRFIGMDAYTQAETIGYNIGYVAQSLRLSLQALSDGISIVSQVANGVKGLIGGGYNFAKSLTIGNVLRVGTLTINNVRIAGQTVTIAGSEVVNLIKQGKWGELAGKILDSSKRALGEVYDRFLKVGCKFTYVEPSWFERILGNIRASALSYECAEYHTNISNSVKNAAPIDGQKALDKSIQIKPTSNRRVSTEGNNFVIFDDTNNGTFHGHIRSWSELTDEMKSILYKNNFVKTIKNGEIIK